MIDFADIASRLSDPLAPLTANTPRFFFEAEDLPPIAFQVTHFHGKEGISQLYHFTIDLVSQDPSIDFNRVVSRKATFTMIRPGVPVRIHGEVSAFFQLGRVQHQVAYRAVLVPRMERLTDRFRSHIYQRITLEDLLTEVLHDHEVRDVRFDLQGSYDPIEYCVQYNETDLAFVCRLMEREGLFFYFEQDMQKETLVITDHQGGLRSIDGLSTIVYREEEGMVTALPEAVQRFICRERAAGPGRVKLKDHNYEMPNEPIGASSGGAGVHAEETSCHYEYGTDHLVSRTQANERAQRRRQALAGDRQVFKGKSNCMGLRSGHRYSLMGHFRPNFNGEYLLVKIKHRGGQESALGMAMNMLQGEHHAESGHGDGTEEQGVYYENKFICRPARVPYRPPRRTPVPKVPGLMVAHIDHPDRSDSQDHAHLDAYAHLDDDGRYKATLNFDEDRERDPADQSLPLHVAQHYAGSNYGTHFPLHGGVEVLLACVNGDPNRPYIVGTVPNPNHASPVTGANKTQNIIRTFSENEMLMEDQEGATKISLTSAGRHNAVLDDGGRHIGLTTSGGHIMRMHDRDKEVHVRTTDGHLLVMHDAEEYMQMQTKNMHILRMDDANRRIGLVTTEGHHLTLHDEEQHIRLNSSAGHKLRFDDGEQYIQLQTEGQHLLRLDDANKSIGLKSKNGHMLTIDDEIDLLRLQSKGQHRLVMSDEQRLIGLQSTNLNRLILSDVEDCAYLTSQTGYIQLDAALEIKLSVGENSITISETGIAINGTDLTEITGQLVTIN